MEGKELIWFNIINIDLKNKYFIRKDKAFVNLPQQKK